GNLTDRARMAEGVKLGEGVKFAEGPKRVVAGKLNVRLGGGCPLLGSRSPVLRISSMRLFDELTQFSEHLPARRCGTGRFCDLSVAVVHAGTGETVDKTR